MEYLMSNYYPSHSSAPHQIHKAIQLRGQTPNLSKEDRTILNQIVHSGDIVGPYSTTPNPYRDPTFTYDEKAQTELDRIAGNNP